MRRVLLIDDDHLLLRCMGMAFRAHGWNVCLAGDGAAALRRIGGYQPSIVVTDLIMPEREGVETIVAIKKAQHVARIIAISGGFRVLPEQLLTLALHLGADRVLAKPFRMAELIGAADALLKDLDP